jgi:uncharacterized protein (DUF885 family)
MTGAMTGTAPGLADELLNAMFDSFPVYATLLGFRERDHLLNDYSEAGDETARARFTDIGRRAEAIDPAGLDAQDRVTRSVILQQTRSMVDRLVVRGVEYTLIDNFSAPAPELLFSLAMVGIAEPAQADAYLARLGRVPETLATIADRHRAGLAAGRLPVRHLVEAAVAHVDRYLASTDSDPLRRPQPPSDGAAFAQARDRVLDEEVRPAFARYRDVLASELAGQGRPADRAGLCWLPDGEDYYTRLVRVHTTTDRTPDDLHQTGLRLIERLAEEYSQVGAEAFGISDPQQVMARLRTDPALRWNSAEELLAAARETIARAEEAAPLWFGRLPSQRCQVQPVPDEEAPGSSAAYYLSPAMDGSRPGIYFANTYRAEDRDRYSSESTAFHEAVPGHHFQLSLAQELTELPLLRRLNPVNAFDEGWGLYAERLADEMGLYSDPVSRLGMLNGDSMRAVRLVVDTGLHAKGWSRQQVIEFMRANTALPDVEIESETDRYIADPGQALAYMVGRLEIQRIRADAERALADRFDIRTFHDTVLGGGPLPLGVLDEVVRDWVGSQTA